MSRAGRSPWVRWPNSSTTAFRCYWPPTPILAATPGAKIIELDETGFHTRTWGQLVTVSLYRRFLADPGYFGLE